MKNVMINTEYITLGQLIKYLGLITNGGEAKEFLNRTEIFVQNELENRRGRKVYPGYSVVIDGQNYKIEAQK